MSSALSTEGAARVRRSGALLGLAGSATLAGQVFTVVAIWLTVRRDGPSPSGWLPAALLLAVSLAAVVAAVRSPVRRRPAGWPLRAAAVALPVGVASGLGAASGLGFDIPQVAAVVLGLSIAVLTPVTMASRALRGLGAGDACVLGIEFVTTLRRADRAGVPRWTVPDEVTVNGTEIVVVVRAGRFGAAQFAIPLAEVTDAAVHAAPSRRGPWLSLPDGTNLQIPPGDVVVIQHGTDTRVLPVFDPEELVAAIAARRVSNCRSTDHSAT